MGGLEVDMYCPKCSQPQVSDEVRFCSRCGFSLSAVRELIASNSALVEHGAEAKGGQLSRGQRGVRIGAWMMLASVALTFVVGLLAAIDEDLALLLFLPLLGFVIGFARVLYGVFLADKRASKAKGASNSHVAPTMSAQPGAAHRMPELSPQRVPIESFPAQRIETAEMVQRPSVTENTTRLLDEESDSRRR